MISYTVPLNPLVASRKAICRKFPVLHILGALFDQAHVNFCYCINDCVLNNVFRCFIGWVDFAGKLQSFTVAHQFGIDVDVRLSFTSEDANRLGLPQTIARHDFD